jgi:hypothetical protein
VTVTIDIAFAANVLLWGVVIVLAILAASRGQILLREGAREGALDFLRVLPRIGLGIIGSGYFAEIVPQSLIIQWIGPNSGLLGVVIAILVGVLTPGGAVVGFAIAATALKSGGGGPQVIAYSTAWALFAFQRLINWELPMLPHRAVWLRVAASLPVPFLAALMAMLLGKP